MGKILKFPSLEQYLAGLKSSGGLIEIKKDTYTIKHLEVEKLALDFGVETSIQLVSCDLTKSCAVVKATSMYQGDKFESFGEVSPLNNDFPYPVSVAEKRAVDRSVLKALGIHGKYYSDVEMAPKDNKRYENTGVVPKNQADIILERIKNTSHQANLAELERENITYLKQLVKDDKAKAEEIRLAFKNRKQQLIGG
nr:hypothetical protein [uncultured Mediterranean phage uvMED]